MTSYTIAAVILGMALSNLPFGALSDRFSVKPIILGGGLVVSLCGFLCAIIQDLVLLIAARFIQGLFVPSLTTCLAAYLAKSLPPVSLNVVMGSYIAATVAGGMGGRLLGGWLHPPMHWRYAFVTSSVLLLAAVAAAVIWLPPERRGFPRDMEPRGFVRLLLDKDLLPIYLTASCAFFAFSSLFNYLPFYLAGPPLGLPTEIITMLYLSYVTGIVVGPLAGRLCNRIGNSAMTAIGAVVFISSMAMTLAGTTWAIIVGLVGTCAGFFAIHAAAAGSLNRALTSGRGRANSLYVLLYYLGGAVGITLSGYAYQAVGWTGVAGLGAFVLVFPLVAGLRGYPGRHP